MNEEEKRPCPFCGYSDVMTCCTFYEKNNCRNEWWEVQCGRCDIEGPGGFTKEEAIKRWNQRNAK